MAAAPLKSVVKQLHSLAAAELSDAQLVERFVSSADEAAFAALVDRHGRLVFGVCRRVLGAGPDLEDVFQATFVVLARKVGSIRKRTSVANWLHGVAYHLATKVRSQRLRRRQRETSVESTLDQIVEKQTMYVDPGVRAGLRELENIIDEELQRLPAGCRDAVILCVMKGLSNSEAAQQLGWPLGTLKTRLMRGRTLLQQHLQKRGVTLSAGVLTVVLTEHAIAAVPAALLRATVQGALHKAVSAKVATLADTGVRLLAAWKLKVALIAMMAISMMSAAAAAVSFGNKAEDDAAEPPVVAQSQAKELVGGEEGSHDSLPNGALARLGPAHWRHGGPVNFVEFLPDGRTVVSAADDRLVRVWGFPSGTELRRFGPGPRATPLLGVVESGFKEDMERSAPDLVALSKDGNLLAMRFDPKEVEVREVATGKKVACLALDDEYDAAALAFTPDGKHLAIAGAHGPIRVWDIVAGRRRTEFGPSAIKRDVRFPLKPDERPVLRYTPDGKTIAFLLRQANKIPSLTFWDQESGKEVPPPQGPSEWKYYTRITSLIFSPDSKLFAFATMEHSFGFMSVDGKNSGSVTGKPVACIGRIATGELLHKWKVSDSTSLAFAADSAKLYSKTSDEAGIQEWDVKTGTLLRQLSAPLANSEWTRSLGCLAPSPDGKTLATAGRAHAVRFIDLATDKDLPAAIGHAYALRLVSYTTDRKSLATAGSDSALHLWDAATGKHIKEFAAPGKSLHMSMADGGYIAVEDRNGISIKNTDGKAIVTVGSGGGGSPKDKGSKDAWVGGQEFYFSPDGRILLVRANREAVLYDIPSGKVRCRVSIPNTSQARSSTAATLFFSPDGQRIALYSYSATRSLTLHDARSGNAMQKFPVGEHAGLRGGTFSLDGRTLALDQGDGVVQLIELTTGKVRHRYGTPYQSGPASWSLYLVSSWPIWSGEAGRSTVALSPDGQMLAHIGMDNALGVWHVNTGQRLARFENRGGRMLAVACAPDGRSVATAGEDTTALIWDVGALKLPAGASPQPLDSDALKNYWKELGSDDAMVGYAAINALVASPNQATAFLKTVLQPVAPQVVAKLIEQLGSDNFNVRQKTQAKLLGLGDPASPFFEVESDRNVTLETRTRLKALQAKLTTELCTGDRLRQIRAIEVLERIGTLEARQVLEPLANGAPGTLLTAQARAALERLKK